MAHKTYKERSIFDKLFKFWYFLLDWCGQICFLMIVATYLLLVCFLLFSSLTFLIIKKPMPIFNLFPTYFQLNFFQLIFRKTYFVFQCFILIVTYWKILYPQERMFFCSLGKSVLMFTIAYSTSYILHLWTVTENIAAVLIETLNVLLQYNFQLAEWSKF